MSRHLAFLAAALAALSTAAGENLLKNPGFEETADGRIANWSDAGMAWYAEPRDAGISPVSIDETEVQGPGLHSVRIDGDGRRGLLRQVLAYNPAWGEKLRISGWMKFKGVKGNLCLIDVELIGEGGKWLANFSAVGDWRKKDMPEWELFQRDITVPKGTKNILVYCRTAKPNEGSVWFDNLSLEPMPLEEAAPKAGSTAIEALIPIDDPNEPDIKWTAGAWGNSKTEDLSISKADAGALRLKFPASKANKISHIWNYDGKWTGLAFKIRRVSGEGSITLNYECGPLAFKASALNPGKDWQTVLIPNEQVVYAWGAKSEEDKKFIPEKIKKISFAHEKATEFEIAGMGLDVRDELSIHPARFAAEAGIARAKERNVLRIGILNAFESPQQVTLKIETRGKAPNPLYEHALAMTLPPRSYQLKELEIPTLETGYYSTKASIIKNGRTASGKTACLCILPEPVRDPKRFMGASGFGINKNNAETGRKLGVQTTEFFVEWKRCEPEKGVYKLDQLEETIDRYIDMGFDVTGMIWLVPRFTTPKWASAAPSDKELDKYFAKDPSDFSRFMEALIGKYKDKVHRWSFVCEVDLSVNNWPNGFDGYIAMTKAGCEGAKRADPNCIIGGIGVSGCDAPNLPVARKLWASLGTSLDGMFFDAYANTRYFGRNLPVVGPEVCDATTYRNAMAIVGAPSSGKHIAVEEKGWAIDDSLPADSPLAWDMADVLSRSFIVARSVDALEHYMWFQMQSTMLEGGYSYSLFRFEAGRPNPRPAAAAYAFTSQFLAGAEEPRRIQLHDDLHIYVFKHGSGSRAALWTTLKEAVPVEFHLPETSRLTDLMSHEIALRDGQTQNVMLSSSPVFLWDESFPAEKMESFLKRLSFKLPCAKLIGMTMPATDMLKVHVKGLSSSEIKGRVTVVPPKGWAAGEASKQVTLAPQGTAVLEFPMSRPAAAPLPEHPGSFSITLEAEGQSTIKKEFDPVFHQVARLKAKPDIDGDLGKYSGFQPIVLEDQSFVSPTDAPPNGLWKGIDDLSAKAWVAWDERNLYFAAKVRDDKFVQENSGSSIWRGDAIQLAIDPQGDALGNDAGGSASYDPDDMEFGIALTPKGPQAFQWIGSPNGIGRLLADAKLAVKREGEFTIYEWAIPWDMLGRKPKPGMVFKFNFIALDVDKPGASPKCWVGLTGGICGGKAPALFHNFVLSE